jgi:hypothetical protein
MECNWLRILFIYFFNSTGFLNLWCIPTLAEREGFVLEGTVINMPYLTLSTHSWRHVSPDSLPTPLSFNIPICKIGLTLLATKRKI